MPSSRTSAGELLFLDTSVLVRLYYLERDDPFAWAVGLAQRPDALLAASHLAYVETLAAFHALRRGRAITSRRQASLSAAFRADWPSFLRVPLSPPVVQLAGALAEEHPLRGADALQLAFFAWLWEKEGQGVSSPWTAGSTGWPVDWCPPCPSPLLRRRKQLKNSPQIRTPFLFRSRFIQKPKTSRRAAKRRRGVK
jgi:predicted nucleic acid-binding protein